MGRFLWCWCFGWLLLVGLATGVRADEVRVCVRPSDIPDSVGRWIRLPGGKTLITASEETFRDKSRGYTVYIFDPNAPPESVQLLPIPHNKLTCKGADLPRKSPPEAAATTSDAAPSGSATGPGPNAVLPQPGAPLRDKPLPVAGATSWLPVAGTNKLLPVAGTAGALSAARGSNRPGGGNNDAGKGDAPNRVTEKTLADKLAEELAYAGAIANQQMNEDVQRPDGKQYGVPGGKNPNGPNSPVAQASAGAVLVVVAVLTAGGLDKKLMDAITKKGRLVIQGTGKVGEKAAEKCIQEYVGKATGEKAAERVAHLADGLNKSGAIGEYSVMAKFTDGMAGRAQAHHILEVKFAKKFNLGNTDKMPSVILSQAEHKAVTARLKVETAKAETMQELWQAYQRAYKGYPDWLKAIESYFVKGK